MNATATQEIRALVAGLTPLARLVRAWCAALQADAVIGADEWARANRIMPADGIEPGPYRPERTPYMVDIMRTMSPSSSTIEGWFLKGTQLGGSVAGENLIATWICAGAGNILTVFPQLDDAKQWELTRFEPMRAESRELGRRVLPSYVKGADNTKLRKKYPGGVMRLIGSNRMPKSTTARYVKLEELPEFPADVGGQGSILDGLRARIRNFGRKAKMYGDASPTLEGLCQISRQHERGDQRRWHLFCPHCQHPQILVWKNFKWTRHQDPRETAASARYACASCATLGTEGEWKGRNYARRPGMTEAQCKAEGYAYWHSDTQGQPNVASWHLPSWNAPLGWAPWGDIILQNIACGDDEDKAKSFSNNTAAEAYSYRKGNDFSAKDLHALAENYPLMHVPLSGLILVAGVDTQDNRLAWVLRAYGRGEESWGIGHGEIYGDTSQPEVWRKLAELLDAPIGHASGQIIRIDAAFIDMGGHRSEEVKAFTRDAHLKGKHWCASLGGKPYDAPLLSKPRPTDFTWRGQVVPGGAEFRYLNTQHIKNLIDGRLKLGVQAGQRRAGPGVFHTPLGFEADYYAQMRSEQRVPVKDKKGNTLRIWVHTSNIRNEFLDCEVLAYAAHLYTMQGRHAESVMRAREKLYAPQLQGDLLDQATAPQTPPAPPTAQADSSTDADADADNATATAPTDTDTDNAPETPETFPPRPRPSPQPQRKATRPPRRGGFVQNWQR